MKRLFNFYAAIFLPLFALVTLSKSGILNSNGFVILLFVYALLYHPVVSGLRLLSLGIISAAAFKFNFIPGWNTRYFGILFFNAGIADHK